MPPLFTITLGMPGVFLHMFRTPSIPYIIPNTLLSHICITGGKCRAKNQHHNKLSHIKENTQSVNKCTSKFNNTSSLC